MIRDVKIALVFLTRLPVRIEGNVALRDLAGAAHLFPVVGLLVGLAAGTALLAAETLALPAPAPALIGLAAAAALTGALHEDGLADTADALGVYYNRTRSLEVMRDSRIGTYGALALVLAVLLKAAALGDLEGPLLPALALAAAAAFGRGLMPVVMWRWPSAKAEGLGAGAGSPPAAKALAAPAMGAAIALILLPWPSVLLALLASSLAAGLAAFLLGRRFGGHTGDTLGAVEQTAETALLLALAALH